MTDFFGRGWNELTLEAVTEYLVAEGDEALMWEVKQSGEPHTIRKQVCGFANSHVGGFLILGIAESQDGWRPDGIELGADPKATIAMIIDDGIRPYPDGIDVKTFAVKEGRVVAVVHVPPISVPPCISRGTVYERLAGRTVAVKDSARLSELFGRGEAARAAAVGRAATAVGRIALQPWDGHQPPEKGLVVSVGVSATGYAPDISSRLFSEAFEVSSRSVFEDVLGLKTTANGGGISVNFWHLQDAVCVDAVRAFGITAGRSTSWHARADWTGGVAFLAAMDANATSTEAIITRLVRPAWEAALALASALEPSGSVFLRVHLEGRAIAIDAETDQLGISLTRGPLALEVDGDVLASIEREIDRARGATVFEPTG